MHIKSKQTIMKKIGISTRWPGYLFALKIFLITKLSGQTFLSCHVFEHQKSNLHDTTGPVLLHLISINPFITNGLAHNVIIWVSQLSLLGASGVIMNFMRNFH